MIGFPEVSTDTVWLLLYAKNLTIQSFIHRQDRISCHTFRRRSC